MADFLQDSEVKKLAKQAGMSANDVAAMLRNANVKDKDAAVRELEYYIRTNDENIQKAKAPKPKETGSVQGTVTQETAARDILEQEYTDKGKSSVVQDVLAARQLKEGNPDALLNSVEHNITAAKNLEEGAEQAFKAAPGSSLGKAVAIGAGLAAAGGAVAKRYLSDRALSNEEKARQIKEAEAGQQSLTKGIYAIRPEGKELVVSPEEMDRREAAAQAAPAPTLDAPPSPQLQAVDARIAQLEQEAEGFRLPEMQDPKKAYDEAMGNAPAETRAAIEKAIALHAVTRDDLRKRELAEGIINAIGMIVAGLWGQAKDVDMSGVKTSKTDWAQRQSLANDDLRTAIGAAEKSMDITEKDAYRQSQLTKDKNAEARQLWEMGLREKQYKLSQERLALEGRKADMRVAAEEERVKRQAALAQSKQDREEAQRQRERLTILKQSRDAMSRLGAAYKQKSGKDEAIDAAVQNLKSVNDSYFNMTGKYIYDPTTLETKEGKFLGIFPTTEKPTPESIKPAEVIEDQQAAPSLGEGEEIRVDKKTGKRWLAKNKQFVKWLD